MIVPGSLHPTHTPIREEAISNLLAKLARRGTVSLLHLDYGLGALLAIFWKVQETGSHVVSTQDRYSARDQRLWDPEAFTTLVDQLKSRMLANISCKDDDFVHTGTIQGTVARELIYLCINTYSIQRCSKQGSWLAGLVLAPDRSVCS
jgi:hypothetical protein